MAQHRRDKSAGAHDRFEERIRLSKLAHKQVRTRRADGQLGAPQRTGRVTGAHRDREATRPPMTPDTAREFAKFLAAGIPILHTLHYFAPDYYQSLRRGERDKWGEHWLRDPLVLAAVQQANGGEWQNLDPGRRLEVGYNKHLAQMAYFLFSHDYSRTFGPDLDKLHEARKALKDYLAGGESANTPWMQFLDDVRNGKIAGIGKSAGAIPAELLPGAPIFGQES